MDDVVRFVDDHRRWAVLLEQLEMQLAEKR